MIKAHPTSAKVEIATDPAPSVVDVVDGVVTGIDGVGAGVVDSSFLKKFSIAPKFAVCQAIFTLADDR